MDGLLKLARRLLLLLALSAIALVLLRAEIGRRPSMNSGIGVVLLGYMIWQITRGLHRLVPKGRVRRGRPELPARAEWVGRRQEQTRRSR